MKLKIAIFLERKFLNIKLISIFLYLFILTPIFTKENAFHSVHVKMLNGFGNMQIPEKDEFDKINFLNTAYTNVSNPDLKVPFFGNIYSSTNYVNQIWQYDFEYRWKENLRISLDLKKMSDKGKLKAQYLPEYPAGPLVDNFFWRESRIKFGIEYFFSFGKIIKIGPNSKYHQVRQKLLNGEGETFAIWNKSNIYDINRTDTLREIGRYSGIVPGLAIEFQFTSWFLLRISGEYLNWHGVKNSRSISREFFKLQESKTYILNPEYGYKHDSGDMIFEGYSGDISFQFGLDQKYPLIFGYHREGYSRKYKNYSYVTSRVESPADVIVNQAIHSAIDAKYYNEMLYLQLDASFDF